MLIFQCSEFLKNLGFCIRNGFCEDIWCHMVLSDSFRKIKLKEMLVMNMDDINDEKNEKKSYLKKLDFIWEKIGNSDVSRFQNIVLHHVLGEYQSGIESRFVSRILDNPNVTPEKLNEYLVDGVQRLVTYAYIGVDRMSNLKKKYKEELDV